MPAAAGKLQPITQGVTVHEDGIANRGLRYFVLEMGATRTQISLTAEQRKKLEALSKRERKPLGQIVRDAVDAYLRTELTPAKKSSEDIQKILDESFGSMPNLQVPSRDEWEERARRIGI